MFCFSVRLSLQRDFEVHQNLRHPFHMVLLPITYGYGLMDKKTLVLKIHKFRQCIVGMISESLMVTLEVEKGIADNVNLPTLDSGLPLSLESPNTEVVAQGIPQATGSRMVLPGLLRQLLESL